MNALGAIIGVLMLAVVAFFGLVFIALGVFGLWCARREERSFLPVQATVLATRLSQGKMEFEHGSQTLSGPIVEYEYRVYEKVYTSTRVFSGGETKTTGAWAQRIIDGYQVGQLIEAFYDPNDPSEAYLIKSSNHRNDRGTYVMLGLGIITVGTCTWLGWMLIRTLIH